MPVHVLGFPGAFGDGDFQHAHMICPAEITGISNRTFTLSALSAPGLSGGAVVCTSRGTPIGYVGGAVDGSRENAQFQAYAYKLDGLPELPSKTPPSSQEE